MNRLQYYHIKLEVFYRGEVKVGEDFTICDDTVGEVGKHLMGKVNIYSEIRTLYLTVGITGTSSLRSPTAYSCYSCYHYRNRCLTFFRMNDAPLERILNSVNINLSAITSTSSPAYGGTCTTKLAVVGTLILLMMAATSIPLAQTCLLPVQLSSNRQPSSITSYSISLFSSVRCNNILLRSGFMNFFDRRRSR